MFRKGFAKAGSTGIGGAVAMAGTATEGERTAVGGATAEASRAGVGTVALVSMVIVKRPQPGTRCQASVS